MNLGSICVFAIVGALFALAVRKLRKNRGCGTCVGCPGGCRSGGGSCCHSA